VIQPPPPSSTTGSNLTALTLTCLLCIFLASQNFYFPSVQSYQNRQNDTIYWESFESIKQDPPHRFAEANPEVPENIPELTPLISTRNQQAAQPLELDLSKNELLPKERGDSQNLKVVPKEESTPANMPLPVHSPPTLETAPPSLPRSAFQDLGKPVHSPDDKSFAIPKSKESTNKKIIDISTPKNGESIGKKPLQQPKEAPMRSRPVLSLEVLNGPLLKKEILAPRSGKVSIECRLNPLGIYMKEMLTAIERQWGILAGNSFSYFNADQMPSKVTYKFTLLSSGQIEYLQQYQEQKLDNLAAELCRQAIASRAPFGLWSEEMIAEFGNSDEIVITFNYQ